MLNIGVLISGGGTNLQAIIDETKSGGINGTVKLVISNKENAYGLERARLSKIKAVYETDEDKIIELLFKDYELIELYIPYDKGEVYSQVKQAYEMIKEEYLEDGIYLSFYIDRKQIHKYQDYIYKSIN